MDRGRRQAPHQVDAIPDHHLVEKQIEPGPHANPHACCGAPGPDADHPSRLGATGALIPKPTQSPRRRAGSTEA
ncbi:hypothetical protein GCM10011504_14380 [Siccirubricoccus deserti]|nr:hypothetical protein GCM10011504_14380 [Siccirubricoccus deserti]